MGEGAKGLLIMPALIHYVSYRFRQVRSIQKTKRVQNTLDFFQQNAVEWDINKETMDLNLNYFESR